MQTINQRFHLDRLIASFVVQLCLWLSGRWHWHAVRSVPTAMMSRKPRGITGCAGSHHPANKRLQSLCLGLLSWFLLQNRLDSGSSPSAWGHLKRDCASENHQVAPVTRGGVTLSHQKFDLKCGDLKRVNLKRIVPFFSAWKSFILLISHLFNSRGLQKDFICLSQTKCWQRKTISCFANTVFIAIYLITLQNTHPWNPLQYPNVFMQSQGCQMHFYKLNLVFFGKFTAIKTSVLLVLISYVGPFI